ncbi:MAG: metallophosphoesterase family protein [Gemmatimonadetes bacterium]|nr:metallophosphoesterase family protein [Gemmatimonadota bacterium]
MGVVSDTHGLLRPEVLPLLEGACHIIHAGDVGDPAILETLGRIAPTTAVRGNTDRGPLASLPLTAALEVEGHATYAIHIPEDLDVDPVAAGLAVVIHGHTHRPRVEWIDGVLHLNPGSIGPRRFSLPITMARVYFEEGGLRPEILDLAP